MVTLICGVYNCIQEGWNGSLLKTADMLYLLFLIPAETLLTRTNYHIRRFSLVEWLVDRQMHAELGEMCLLDRQITCNKNAYPYK